MTLDLAVVIRVRHQFGDVDQDIGVYAAREQLFSFDCPGATSSEAILLFQSSSVGAGQRLQLNGMDVAGGIPLTDAVAGFTNAASSGPGEGVHSHAAALANFGWVGNVLITPPNLTRARNNSLRIISDGDNFIVDNLVCLYRRAEDRETVSTQPSA